MEAQKIPKIGHIVKITISDMRPRGRPPRGSPPPQLRHISRIRTALDHLATSVGLVYQDGGPRDAELVRVLLVAELLIDAPEPLRIGAAIYTNSVLGLSRAFAITTSAARASLWKSAASLSGLSSGTKRPPVEKPRLPERGGTSPNREQVHVVLDDWLRGRLRERLQHDGRGAASVMRDLLLKAIENRDKHEPVVRAYVCSMQRVEDAIRKAVVDEYAVLTQALAELSP